MPTKSIALLSMALALAMFSACAQPEPLPSPSSARRVNDKEESGKKKDKCFGIVNGTETTAYEAIVSIARSLGANQYHFCTGTFIASNAILTAAHCLDNSTSGGLRYMAGADISLTGFNDTFAAAPQAQTAIAHGNTYRHGSFNASDDTHRQHDAAVLIFNSDIAPATYPVATARPANGSAVRLTGFGQISLNTPLSGAVKRRTGTNTLTSHPDTQLLVVDGPLTTTAGTNNTTAVMGDSGGPLLYNDQVVGVFSSVVPSNELDLYVDVTTDKVTDLLVAAAAQGAKIPGYYTFPEEPPEEETPDEPAEDLTDDTPPSDDLGTDAEIENAVDVGAEAENEESGDVDDDTDDGESGLLFGNDSQKQKSEDDDCE